MFNFACDAPVNVILPVDPALDDESSDYSAYMADGAFDESALSFKDGCEPTRFRIRQTTHRSRMWIDNYGSDYARKLAKVRWGLIGIIGPNAPQIERKNNNQAGGDVITEKWMDSNFCVPESVITWLSNLIDLHSELSPFSRKQ